MMQARSSFPDAGDGAGWHPPRRVAGGRCPRPGLGRWLSTGGLFLLGVAVAGAAAPSVALPVVGLGPSLRLRVIAATDSATALQAKLQVRDSVLAVLGPQLVRARSLAQAEDVIRAQLPQLRQAAARAAARWGETARVRLGLAPFPVEHLGWLAFAAGRYPALVVTLGAGRGRNWWTLLFPSLAFVTWGHHWLVVGPAEGPASSPGHGHRLRPIGPNSVGGMRVQLRFALWELLRSVPWSHLPLWLRRMLPRPGG